MGCPRRRAYRRGTEEAVKPHSLFCNSVQVGRIKLRCPGAVHRPGALIVCQNHDNIRFFPCFFHIIRFSFLLLCFCFLILCIDCLKDLFTALTSPGLAQLLYTLFDGKLTLQHIRKVLGVNIVHCGAVFDLNLRFLLNQVRNLALGRKINGMQRTFPVRIGYRDVVALQRPVEGAPRQRVRPAIGREASFARSSSLKTISSPSLV